MVKTNISENTEEWKRIVYVSLANYLIGMIRMLLRDNFRLRVLWRDQHSRYFEYRDDYKSEGNA